MSFSSCFARGTIRQPYYLMVVLSVMASPPYFKFYGSLLYAIYAYDAKILLTMQNNADYTK